MFTQNQNRCSRVTRIGVHGRPEYARVIYHQEPEQTEPLDLSVKPKAQQTDESTQFHTGQLKLSIDVAHATGSESKRTYFQDYYTKNKDTLRAKQQDYYTKNKDTIRAKQQDYYTKNKATILAKKQDYYTKNKDTILAKRKDYRAKNKDTLRAKQQDYRAKNKDTLRDVGESSQTVLIKSPPPPALQS